MNKKTTLLLAFLISAINFGQKKPEASIQLDSKITDVNLHQTTGISIITTQGGVYGINGETGDIIWKFKESGFVKSLNTLGQDENSSFREIPLSPFGQFNQTVFNIKTGEKIIDNTKDNYEKIIDNKTVFVKKAKLFFVKKDKREAELFLVSIENDTFLWKTTIQTNKNLESLFDSVVGGVSNFIQNETQIAFSAGKTVFLINLNDGEIIFSKKYDAGKLFFSENNNLLITVENRGSSMIGGAFKAALTMGGSLKVIGKELLAYNTKTGEQTWKKPIKLSDGFINYQFEDNKLFLIHGDGGKLYDYNNGTEVWKKDFKKNKVKRVEKNTEGYIVYYKNKKHLVDNSGKKIWKRPQKVIKNVDFEVDDEEEFTSFNYDKGTIFVTPYRIEYFEKGKEKRVYRIGLDEKVDKIAYDEKNKNLILLRNKKLFILNPDKGLGKDQVKKIKFNDYSKISSIEVRNNSYFINSNWEYVITDFKGDILKKEYFKQPGEGLRHLKNIGSIALGVGGMYSTASGVMNASGGGILASTGNFVGHRNAAIQGEHIYNKGTNQYHGGAATVALANYLWDTKRYNAFKSIKNSAFFYTKKDDKKVLLQVSKDNGEIIDTYEFGVNKPKYKIDKAGKKIYFRKNNELKIFNYND